METCCIEKSKSFGPGANDLLKGMPSHCTWSWLNPSSSASAYANADSYPSPVYGSPVKLPDSQSEPSVLLPPYQGLYAGLPVAMVSVPSFTSVASAAHVAASTG